MEQPTDSAGPWIDMAPGVRRRTLASGDALMLMQETFTAGSRLPSHQHVHEQVSFVVSGRIRFTLDGSDVRDLGPGDALYLRSNVPHGAEALEDTVVTDTFNPPRADLLEQDRAQGAPTARV